MPSVSSSLIRARAAGEEAVDGLVCPEVAAYIRRYGLYSR